VIYTLCLLHTANFFPQLMQKRTLASRDVPQSSQNDNDGFGSAAIELSFTEEVAKLRGTSAKKKEEEEKKKKQIEKINFDCFPPCKDFLFSPIKVNRENCENKSEESKQSHKRACNCSNSN
jgi:hypothetical protein